MGKLTIEHLAPYMPYGLKIEILNYKQDYTGVKQSIINGFYYLCNHLYVTYDFGNTGKSEGEFKPYLRPLCQLTQEIEHNGEKFVPIVELAKIGENDHFCDNELRCVDQAESVGVGWTENEIRYVFVYSKKQRGFYLESIPYQKLIIANQDTLYRKLHEWHFDVHGLIDKGLALPL